MIKALVAGCCLALPLCGPVGSARAATTASPAVVAQCQALARQAQPANTPAGYNSRAALARQCIRKGGKL